MRLTTFLSLRQIDSVYSVSKTPLVLSTKTREGVRAALHFTKHCSYKIIYNNTILARNIGYASIVCWLEQRAWPLQGASELVLSDKEHLEAVKSDSGITRNETSILHGQNFCM